jgi:hypothetical protein
MSEFSKRERAELYLIRHNKGVKLEKTLGSGTDGAVWSTDQATAVKVFDRESGYFNERDTYLRLAEFGVTNELAGFRVAEMVGYDDELMVVEMQLMQKPPFVIDFAKVRLNSSPDFSDEVLAQNEAEGRELFGDNWPAVVTLLEALESFLIFYLDPKPHNIVFPSQPEET